MRFIGPDLSITTNYFGYFETSPEEVFANVVEVGGDLCLNAALMIGEYGCKQTIIDWPETISLGFTFLKAALPSLRIALLHTVHDHLCTVKNFDTL